jgi:hypothetical protein
MQWFGKPVPQNRFLGKVDQDDPTNLPMGLASLCRNYDFTRDSGGPTCATKRCGYNTAMQCLDATAPVTGALSFVYSPESSSDPDFQMPLAFQPTEGSQYESPVGTGRMVKFPQTNFTEPQSSHAIQVSAGNKIFSAYSDLKKPLSMMSTMDPKAKTLNPFGMKPVGWHWAIDTQILANEVCTPSTPTTGNGHTYQAQNAGYTGPEEPTWPTTDPDAQVTATRTAAEGAEVTEVLSAAQIAVGYTPVTWKEKTMVIANRLPPLAAPTLTLGSGGTITSGQDVYIVTTLINTAGETLASAASSIETTGDGSSVNVQIPELTDLTDWIQSLSYVYIPTQANVYVAIVNHGAAAPARSTYALYGASVALGTLVNVTTDGAGTTPPNVCTARVTPGQLPTPTDLPDIQRVPAGSTVNPPGSPGLSLVDGGGTFGAGRTIYIELTLVNSSGETTPGGVSNITTTIANQGVRVSLAANYGATVTSINVYEADVSEGSDAPATTSYKLVGNFALGSTPIVTTGASGAHPPTENTATLPTGNFPAGRDVYVAMTYTNASGETPLGPGNSIIDTNADDSVEVTVAVPLGPENIKLYSISSVGIYEADVATGDPAPDKSAYSLVGYYQPLAQIFILQAATGSNPPLINSTGPGGAIAMDTLTGGPNGTQGYRYAVFGWINQMETYSGFTESSAVKTDIDEDGWEIGAFNILFGMPNVIGRYIAFCVADGSQAGPFNWIGLVDIQVPTQNDVYPTRTLVDLVNQSATVFLDNTTNQGVFNFTDTYLIAENNVDDRMDIAISPMGARVDYLASVDRLAITGVPGLTSGVWISLEGDYESFYGDDSPVPIVTNGEKCFGVTDRYKGIPFALMEESGFVLSPNTGNPETWKADNRWDGMGPCGFRAWDANGKMIIFAHRSGLYKYSDSDPDMMQKEIPREWASINWAACETICVKIDEDTHTVQVLAPIGASTVPNVNIVLSYIEGWQGPIHFSTFAGKEISMDAARRWSENDLAAYVCVRMKRTLPPDGNVYMDGPSWNTLQDSSFGLTQLLFGSSGPDGTIQARTPGIYSDNGSGIRDEYETMSCGLMQAVCKPEGFNLNACGQGTLLASFLASREMESDEGGPVEAQQEMVELAMAPIPLIPQQVTGITRKCEAGIVNEFWRMRFRTDWKPGSWCSLKCVTPYVIPFTMGRDSGDR